MSTTAETLAPPDWKFRDDTWDRNIFDIVVRDNEYRLPENFKFYDAIIDVGAHIGSFSYACFTRGAGYLFAYEADYDNYQLACQNLWKLDGNRILVYRSAIWRNDVWPVQLVYNVSREPKNTGGGDVLFTDPLWPFITQQLVPTCALDTAIDDALWRSRQKRIRLLKLDCEGSEWPALLTSKRLDCVNEIVGEFHEIGGQYDGYTMPDRARVGAHTCYVLPVLKSLLEAESFRFEYQRHKNADGTPSSLGLFWAKRT